MKTLPEILNHGLWNEGLNAASDYGTRKYGKRKEAALTTAIDAIAKELMGIIGEDEPMVNHIGEYTYGDSPYDSATVTYGRNTMLDEVRARLTVFIGHKEK